jgi:hypothetical protein
MTDMTVQSSSRNRSLAVVQIQASIAVVALLASKIGKNTKVVAQARHTGLLNGMQGQALNPMFRPKHHSRPQTAFNAITSSSYIVR